jgi:hypothetical protein
MTRLFLLAVFFLLLTAPVYAETREGAFSMTLGGAAYLSDGVQHQKIGPGFTARLGYDITKRYGVEAAYDFILSQPTKLKSGHAERNIFRIDALYYFLPECNIVPYLSGGVGWIASNLYSQTSGFRTDLMLNFGVGAKYFLTDSIAIRGDIREIGVFEKGHILNTEAVVGLTYYFGQGKSKAGVRQPVSPVIEPPPAQAPGSAPAPEPAPVKMEPTSWQGEATTVPEGKIMVTGMRIDKNALEITATEHIRNYKVFTLSQSSRLVIDISNAVSGFAANRIPIHNLGIAAVRFGSFPDYLRVVLDAEQSELLPYRIEETEKGLKIIVVPPDQNK